MLVNLWHSEPYLIPGGGNPKNGIEFPPPLGLAPSMLLAGVICFSSVFAATPTRSMPSESCDLASSAASEEIGVPLDILLALTRMESGRPLNGQLAPWPWTLNVEGKGYWFKDRNEALDFMGLILKQGRHSIDIGCFQVNAKWHGSHFVSLEHMIDPIENATYAAEFLKSLFDETGDWLSAVEMYHSRTPDLARAYGKKYTHILKQVASNDRLTRFSKRPTGTKPLLVNFLKKPGYFAAPSVRMGSLVSDHLARPAERPFIALDLRRSKLE